MRILPLLLVALLAPTAALAEGGRVVAVLEDGVRDVTLTHYQAWVAPPEVDVERVTFSLTDDHLVVQYDVLDLAHRVVPEAQLFGVGTGETSGFFLQARSPGYSLVGITALWAPPQTREMAGPHFFLALVGEEGECRSCGEWPELAGEWNVEEDRVTVLVPRAHFTGDLTHVRVTSWGGRDAAMLRLGDLVPDHAPGPAVPLR
ncbi:MAG TPA: hypothetical protein VNX21_01840 [Candidatus Thermoplasmatota archaeon]|nr:hypothetical protein [Candidatus Thermoplasmatota archaeon]